MYIRTVGMFVLFLLSSATVYAQVATSTNVETRVREYFKDVPVMIEIARCESKFRQLTDTGNPFYGGAGGAMVGVFQIHTTVHQSYAKSLLGFDITTLEGNLGYAKYLYQTEGTKPWMSSYACWGSTSNAQPAAPGAAAASGVALTANLSFGTINPQVLTLQKMLNEKGFTVANDGPGSPGQETQLFGALTRAAVRKFQCATISVCDGGESTTGFGRVGPRTRVALTAAGTAAATQTSTPSVPTTTATSTPNPVSSGGGNYSASQQAEVEQLQAKIEELTSFLELYQTGEQQP